MDSNLIGKEFTVFLTARFYASSWQDDLVESTLEGFDILVGPLPSAFNQPVQMREMETYLKVSVA